MGTPPNMVNYTVCTWIDGLCNKRGYVKQAYHVLGEEGQEMVEVEYVHAHIVDLWGWLDGAGVQAFAEVH